MADKREIQKTQECFEQLKEELSEIKDFANVLMKSIPDNFLKIKRDPKKIFEFARFALSHQEKLDRLCRRLRTHQVIDSEMQDGSQLIRDQCEPLQGELVAIARTIRESQQETYLTEQRSDALVNAIITIEEEALPLIKLLDVLIEKCDLFIDMVETPLSYEGFEIPPGSRVVFDANIIHQFQLQQVTAEQLTALFGSSKIIVPQQVYDEVISRQNSSSAPLSAAGYRILAGVGTIAHPVLSQPDKHMLNIILSQWRLIKHKPRTKKGWEKFIKTDALLIAFCRRKPSPLFLVTNDAEVEQIFNAINPSHGKMIIRFEDGKFTRGNRFIVP